MHWKQSYCCTQTDKEYAFYYIIDLYSLSLALIYRDSKPSRYYIISILW